MNDNNNTSSVFKGRRVFRILALFLLVVVLPAGSWYYLRSGLDWRIAAKSELGAYGTIPPSYIVFPGNDKINLIESCVCVVHDFGDAPEFTPENKFIMDEANKMAEGIGVMGDKMVRLNFRVIMLANNGSAEFRSYYQKFATIDNATWLWRPSTESWRRILQQGYQQYCEQSKVSPTKEYFALTDTGGIVLRYYNAMDPAEIGRMVEHISMVMPKEGGR
jgi:hypothetical protein